MTTNGKQAPGILRSLQNRMEFEAADSQGYYKAIQEFQQVKGNIFDLLNMANLPQDKFEAVVSLYTRGLTRLKRQGKDVEKILNERDRWHELPLPLIEAIVYCVGSNANLGQKSMQTVMNMTGTILVPKSWQNDYKVVKSEQQQDEDRR